MAKIESCQLCQRKVLVSLVRAGVGVSEAARQAGMSRKSAYKWLDRVARGGELEAALGDKSRAREVSSALVGQVADALIALRREHPRWGPRKLLQRLKRLNPRRRDWPASSTVGELLKREGLVEPRRRRVVRHPPFRYAGPTPPNANDRWTMDFKGDFRLGNGLKCLPFTLRDASSRMVLSIQVMSSTKFANVKEELTSCFKVCGLPKELQRDNGPPFATTGLARLSKLSVWLMQLGVSPVLSRPAKPQDNGGHERMHRDLGETTRPPCRTASGQQRRFGKFLRVFNEERPHDALGGDVPAQHWSPSPRHFPSVIVPWIYPVSWEIRHVNAAKPEFSWRNTRVRFTDALAGHDIAFEPFQEGIWRIHFCGFALGLLDERGAEVVVRSFARPDGHLSVRKGR